MAAVRALPGFRAEWETRMVKAPLVGTITVEDGKLLAAEQRFRKGFAGAARAFDEAPLCAQDVCDIALCLDRVLAMPDAAGNVLRSLGRLPGEEVRARN